MYSIDAYHFTLTKVLELKNSGINVLINPIRSRSDNRFIRKNDMSGKIPPEIWVNVSFSDLSKEQALKINKVANYLGMSGIIFDTGGSKNYRDWELDWSFSYIKGEENWGWRDVRDRVEEIINQIT